MNEYKILQKFADGSITPAEAAAFREYRKSCTPEALDALMAHYQIIWEAQQDYGATKEMLFEAMGARIQAWEPAPVASIQRVPLVQRKWLRYAAMVLVVAGTVAYFFFQQNLPGPPAIIANGATDQPIAPAQTGAVLTLADGSQVVLDSMVDGVIAAQNGSEVVLDNGRIAYAARGQATGSVAYNTMSTPKGRQFQVTLPDGTQVWLNAASSIRYPTTFVGSDRKVFVTGETYFEVTPHATQPFRVNINDKVTVDVLGTAFNVEAYDNEARIHTTLLSGSIAVSLPSERQVVLQPGQQAVVTHTQQIPSDINIVQNADLSKVMAWKNGLFNFDGLTFEEIMRQIERWYDIEVVYAGNAVRNKRLAGEMTRGVPLQGLLKNLEKLGLRYQIQGRVVTLLP